ncbi:MAG: nicotinate (nicotinamide) nucleotide adenylyltransferase [Balneolaceae bacterium]|nr:nicotinate (nicotinamide) nucleotide adenylyltransferase [Balneolaceae bacterium]
MGHSDHAIGILGGTFDPVHRGHVSIADSFVESPYIDRLFLVLTPHPPHKEGRDITDFDHRMNMLQLAFEDREHIRVTGIENELPRPSYTIQTLRYFKNQYRETDVYLCLGEDSLAGFKNWYQWAEILELCDLLVAGRPDTEEDEIDPELLAHTHFVDHNPVDISSTELRSLYGSGKHDSAEKLVPDNVAAYIREQNLYSNNQS